MLSLVPLESPISATAVAAAVVVVVLVLVKVAVMIVVGAALLVLGVLLSVGEMLVVLLVLRVLMGVVASPKLSAMSISCSPDSLVGVSTSSSSKSIFKNEH